MDQAKTILDKVIGQVFGFQNPLSLEEAKQKFAYDIRLPQEVYDSTTNELTWSRVAGASKYMTIPNSRKRTEIDDWMLPKRQLNGIEDILAAWSETNYMSTERYLESTNVIGSDNIYNCENVYFCHDCTFSKNILYCDSIHKSEFVVASQRSQSLSFCLRTEDSKGVSNSFSVVWSGKVTNSLFIQDCYDVHDSMFCSHISSKRFCIANMQFEEEEYKRLREEVVRWILTS